MSDGQFQIEDDQPIPDSVYADVFIKAIQKCEELKKEKVMTGVEWITQERLEQKVKHNKTIKGDWEQYPDFELAQMAEALLRGDKGKSPVNWSTLDIDKMFNKSYEERLVIAGALIAAQLDVLKFTE